MSTDLSLPAPYPDPEQEITVWINSDAPLIFMNLLIHLTGDYTITGVMDSSDQALYGWTNPFFAESCINEDRSISMAAFQMGPSVNGTIGYIKFRCNSGRVTVYLDKDYSTVIHWGQTFSMADAFLEVGSYTLPPVLPDTSPQPILIHGTVIPGPPRPEQPPLYLPAPSGLPVAPASSYIEIVDDITTNQVWTADNVYYILNYVEIQALLVIEPGTTIIFAEGCGLFVTNGGCLISRGTPNNVITYTADFLYFYYPEDIGYYWHWIGGRNVYYFCAIYITESASPASAVSYNFVEGAFGGIALENITLDSPVENNFLFGNGRGIYQTGPKLTDVRNNLCFYNNAAGIEIYFSDPAGNVDGNTVLNIEHNTCDAFQFYGIYVSGSDDPNHVPTVHLKNNLVSNNYWFGIALDSTMWYTSVHNGYAVNRFNQSDDFGEVNPAFMNEWPYNDHYLPHDCNFIDAGSTYIELTSLMGTTTDANSLPDTGIVDIGFHYNDWAYTGQTETNAWLDDVITLSNYWLTYTPYDPNSPGYLDPNLYDPNFVSYGGDWNDDGFVDMADFALLASNWKKYEDYNLTLSFDQNPGSVSGELTVTLNAIDPAITETLLFMDGQFVCRLEPQEDEPGQVTLDTRLYRNGEHGFKLIAMVDEQIVSSSITTISVDNALSSLTRSDGYRTGKDYILAGISNDNYVVQLVDDITETMTFSEESTNGLLVKIPSSAFTTEDGPYSLKIGQYVEAASSGAGSTGEIEDNINYWYDYFLTHAFDKSHAWNPPAKIIISVGSDVEIAKDKCLRGVFRTAFKKLYRPILLSYNNCTMDNLKFCLNLPQVKMWYHTSHGNYRLVRPFKLGHYPIRQNIETKDGKLFSYLKKDFGANVPADYESMGVLEKEHSLPELGIPKNKLTWVQFNCCNSATTQQFPVILGIIPRTNNYGVFIGWKKRVFVNDILIKYGDYEEELWKILNTGYDLEYAVENAADNIHYSPVILDNFWYYSDLNWQYIHFRYPNIN